MSKIQDLRLVSKTSGCSRISALCENVTTGIASIFSVRLGIPEDGVSYSYNTLKGRVPETEYNTDCGGEGQGLTPGDTTYEAGTLSISYADAFNRLNVVDPTICREIVLAIFMGGSFKLGGDVYTVIGTNGTRNIGGISNNNDHKFLFLEEGKVIRPDEKNLDGTMVTEANSFITAYKKNNPIICEFLYAFSDTEKKGDRFVYVLANSASFNEGSGASRNTYSVEANRYCDAKGMDKYLIDGLSDYQVMATSGADEIFRVNADTLITVAGGGTPTVAGIAGDQCVVVNSTDGTVETYLYGTDWATVPVTSTLGEGAVIYSQSIATSLDGSGAVTKAGFTAIKTAGTTGNAVAVNFKTGATGSGSDTYVCDTFDWVYSAQEFQTYTGVEI